MFQSSRPVAGARIRTSAGTPHGSMRFNPRAPLPGRASVPHPEMTFDEEVSILAPRCRGAHHRSNGARVLFRCFNPRAPLPGRASGASPS